MLAVTDMHFPEKYRGALVSRGFEVVSLPPFSALDPRVASHPDMLMLPLGNRLFVHKDYYAEAKTEIDTICSLAHLSLFLTADEIRPEYPFDISLNIAIAGKLLLGRCDCMAKAVVKYAEEIGNRRVNVKQGYAKCATVVLGDRAIITADPTIERIGRSLSLDVLHIAEGNVTLDGYSHGFIGGASGVYKNTIFFCGNLSTHPDGKRISDFCTTHGFDSVSLSDDPLYDVGTIFFF